MSTYTKGQKVRVRIDEFVAELMYLPREFEGVYLGHEVVERGTFPHQVTCPKLIGSQEEGHAWFMDSEVSAA